MKRLCYAMVTVILLTWLPPGIAEAATSSRPKCSGYSLVSYKKDLKIFNKDWADYQNDTAVGQTTEDPQIHQLIRLDYQVWLQDGYFLEKWAKACRVKMPQSWLDMLNSTPN